eukprot:Em0001g403a
MESCAMATSWKSLKLSSDNNSLIAVTSRQTYLYRPTLIPVGFETEQHTVIAMEYMPRGELFDYVWERRGLSEGEAREMFVQIVEALDYCHKKTSYSTRTVVRSSPISASRARSVPSPPLSTYCGSPLYASPEMIFGKPYQGPECDVWSLGVILYCILTATMPFDDSNPTRFLQVIQKGHYTAPPSVSDSARDLISRMLDPNSKTRASVSEILGHRGHWGRGDASREAAEIASVVIKMGGGGDAVLDTSAKDQLCSCACHHEEVFGGRDSGDRKDSVVVPAHCEDCSLQSANRVADDTP